MAMTLTERLREYLEGTPQWHATLTQAAKALGVTPEQIHAAVTGDYWIISGVFEDTGETYVALEGE
jgi:hypothetical protein